MTFTYRVYIIYIKVAETHYLMLIKPHIILIKIHNLFNYLAQHLGLIHCGYTLIQYSRHHLMGSLLARLI